MSEYNINSRLKQLREYFNMNQSRFADSLGISQSGWSLLEKGRNDISVHTLKSVMKVYNVNANWIVNGVGSMFLSEESTPSDSDLKKLITQNRQLQNNNSQLTKEVKELKSVNAELQDAVKELKGENKGLMAVINIFSKNKSDAV